MVIGNADSTRGRVAALALALAIAAAAPATAQDIKRGNSGSGSSSPRSTVRVTPRAPTIRVALKIEAPLKVVAAGPSVSKLAQTHYKSANDFLDQNKNADAIREYEAAIKANPKFADAWYGLGVAHHNEPDLDAAANAWKKAVLLDPKLYQAHAGLANTYMETGEFELAVKEYKALAELKPNYAEALFGLGTVLYQLKRFDEAVPQFEKAIALQNGNYPDARFNLAQTYYALNDAAKAEDATRKAIAELGPDAEESAVAYNTLGTILYNKSDYNGSIEAYNKMLALCKGCASDDLARVYYNQSLSFQVLGKKAEEAAALDKCLKYAPYLPNAADLKARLAKLRE